MIKTLAVIFERMFGLNKKPQFSTNDVPQIVKKRKKVDRTVLTSAQTSLVKDALLANAKANLSGYGKTNKQLGEDFNRIFNLNKSESSWKRTFKRVMTDQSVGE